ncbi:MAG: fibronectin type III domain-containing protein, partial [Thermoanaerobaculia bacterium]
LRDWTDLAKIQGSSVVALPGNAGAGILDNTIVDAAPFHGARRILMRVVDFAAAPVRPAAPADVTARPASGQLRIEWTPVPEALGYRVEYRVGDGSWIELSRWFDKDELLATFSPVRAGLTYSFRVRAFGDGGASAYSDPAIFFVGKRRAVR